MLQLAGCFEGIVHLIEALALSDCNKSKAKQSTPKLVTLCSATDDIISLIKNMTSSRYIVHIWCHKTLPEGFKHVHLSTSYLASNSGFPFRIFYKAVNLAIFISLLWQCLQAALVCLCLVHICAIKISFQLVGCFEGIAYLTVILRNVWA